MNFNIFNSIILAGVIQGFIFALVVIFNKKYRARSTYFLLAWIVSYSFNNLQWYLLDSGVIGYHEFYDYIFIQWGLVMPPLIILYSHLLLNPEKKISIGEKLLFLPFLIGFILSLTYKILRAIKYKSDTLDEFFQLLVPTGEFLAIIFSIGAIFYMLIKIHKHRKKLRFSSHKVIPQLNWFKNTLFLLLLATIIWAYSEYTYGDDDDVSYFYPLWILVAFLIYWLGHIGIYKYGVNEQRKKIRKTVHDRYSITKILPQKNDHITAIEKYLKGQRNFLNPNISLEDVANELNLSTGHLSKLINTELEISFKDYLNNLRIEEAKLYLKDPEFSNYTMAAIGLEAGFNSKSAFNASFKKITGLTPSQFRK